MNGSTSRMDSINACGKALKVPPKKAISPQRPDLRTSIRVCSQTGLYNLQNTKFPMIVGGNHALIAVDALKRASTVGQETG